MEESELIIERYKKRDRTVNGWRYSEFNPAWLWTNQERHRTVIRLLWEHELLPVANKRVLDVGCGEGPDLLFLLWLGFAADNLAGIDLRPEVIEKARQRLPTAVDLRVGDATTAGFDPESFDIVQQVTVFSSLLADDSQVSLAHWMWNLVKPGGGIIWYDFIYDNPMNTDVRGVSLKRLRELFPGGEMSYRRVTLAPPISRFVCRIHPMSYGLLNSFSFLRTHVLCWIAKPSMVIRCK